MWAVAGAVAAAGAAGILVAERQQIDELRRQFEEQRKRAEPRPPTEPAVTMLAPAPSSPTRSKKKPNVAPRTDPVSDVPHPEPVSPARNQPQPQVRKENPPDNPPSVAPSVAAAVEVTPPEAKPAEVKPSAASLLEMAGGSETRGDYNGASQIYKSLADAGSALAQKKLGDMYATGHGFAPNDTTAAGWYRKAANQGDGAAQLKLGDMHANGRGVPQNYNQAYIWYSLALRSGMTAAEAPRKKAAAMLQPAEINQADRVVDSWQKALGK
jgi:hypothetical protein